MFKLLRYLKKYWWASILAPLCMILEVSMDMQLTKEMSRLLTAVQTSQGLNSIANIGLMMMLWCALGITGGVLAGVFTNIASYNFSNDLRKDIFKKIMNLSYNQTDEFSTGSLVTRVTNDVTQIQNFVAMSLRGFVRAASFFVLGIVYTINMNVSFAVTLAIALPIEIIVMILVIIIIFPIFGKVQKQLDGVNTVVHENVSGARVVKAFSKEEYENKRFVAANDKYTATLLKVSKIAAALMPIMTIIIYGTQIAIYFIGGKTIIDEYVLKTTGFTIVTGVTNVSEIGDITTSISLGETVASVTYITLICNALLMLGMVFSSMGRAMASAKRINEVLDSSLDIVDGDLNIDDVKEVGTIEFKNVCFKYPKSSGNVLDNINLIINKGETVAIVGATGSGKSSLVNLIARFYDVTSGEVLVDGYNVKDYKQIDLRNKIAMVLQKSELFADTMEGNILWGNPWATHEEVVWAADIAQAREFIESKPEKYDEFVEEKGASLSGGQKQRLSIARAILKKPEIIVFDDSTSALDLVTEAKLYKAMNKELKDTTKIVVAQRIATAKNADKIAVLDKEHIVAYDTHENLLKTCEVYQDIYNSQLKKEGVFDAE